MSKIMELFYGDLGAFQNDMEKEQWEVKFLGEKYPPRVGLVQLTPPLFEETADGLKKQEPACIQIIGRPDLQVITTGKLAISKKDLTKMVNRAAQLLELFLHGFMQERKEMEAEQG